MEPINYVNRKALEEIDERKLIIGLIVSTDFIKQIREYWNINYLEDSTAKKIAYWCMDYYDKYKLAPSKHFEELFYRKLKVGDQNSEIMEDLKSNILPGLSKQAEEEKFNLQFWIDGAMALFRRRHFELHTEQLNDLIKQSLLDQADKLVKEFKPLEISITDDLDKHIQTVEQMESSEISQPRLLIYPWLKEGETTIIYGEYGTGKSLLAILIAYLSGVKEYDSEYLL
jgi:DNA replication protein DnaC